MLSCLAQKIPTRAALMQKVSTRAALMQKISTRAALMRTLVGMDPDPTVAKAS